MKRIFAILVGVLILVAVIFVARWVGEKIRENFLKPATPQVVVLPPDNTNSLTTDLTNTNPGGNKTASYSAIPKTGPEEMGFVMMAVSMFGGLSSFALARKKA